MKLSAPSVSITAMVAAYFPTFIHAFTAMDTPAAAMRSRRTLNSLASGMVSTPNSSKNIPAVTVDDANHPLLQRANEYIYTQSGFYSAFDESVHSDDFVFRGPYIGPLNKKDYQHTLGTFGIYQALPDISPNAFGFSLDPVDPNRVWFMVRNTGTFTGEPGLGLGNGQYIPPNGATVQGCPETFSIIFDEEHKVRHLSVGYVADRFEGNTQGDGAAVGIFRAIGVPFPSPGPLLTFAQWFGTEVVRGGPLSYSTEDVPAWWTEKSAQKASEGFL